MIRACEELLSGVFRQEDSLAPWSVDFGQAVQGSRRWRLQTVSRAECGKADCDEFLCRSLLM
jgi:hypothetical protein